MTATTIFFRGNDMALELKGLMNEKQGTFINNATVQGTLVDDSGNPVSGQSWPVTLAYVTGSDGDYEATASHAMVLVAGHRYTMNLTADGGAGLYASWQVPCVARDRQE